MSGAVRGRDSPSGNRRGPLPATAAAWVQVGLVTALTLAGYAALWPVQRSLFLAGLDPAHPLTFPRMLADPAPAQSAFLRAVLLGGALVVLHLWLVVLTRRWTSPWLTRAALAVPAGIAVTLWLAPPSLSIDAYSYLAHGYLATHGGDPYAAAAAEVGRTPFGPVLGRAGWQAVHPPTPYGPLWTLVERLVVGAAGTDVTLGILLIKLPALLAVLGSAAVLFTLLGHLHPELRTPGTLLWLGNPLVLVEFAGDGHNDAVALLLLLLALLGCARRSPVIAIVALGLAVLTKATPAVFALPMAVFLITRRRSWPRLAGGSALGAVVVAGIAAASYAPYWRGVATFAGMGATATPGPSWSVAGFVWGLQSTDPVADPTAATAPTLLTLTALLLAGAALASAMARSLPGLVAASAALSLLTLLLLPAYWPWYGALPLPFLALLAGWGDTAAASLLALGSRLVAPIGDLAAAGVVGYDTVGRQQVLLGQTVPAALGLLLVLPHLLRPLLRRGRRRMRPASPAPAETPRLQ